jgi:predicted nuclease with TOPRIM domain
MTDHIYGRGASLVSEDRPHMFCQELELYVNYYEKLIGTMGTTEAEIKYLEIFKENLEEGIELILKISEENSYPNENLKSIPGFVTEQHDRLKQIYTERNELAIAVNF